MEINAEFGYLPHQPQELRKTFDKAEEQVHLLLSQAQKVMSARPLLWEVEVGIVGTSDCGAKAAWAFLPGFFSLVRIRTQRTQLFGVTAALVRNI